MFQLLKAELAALMKWKATIYTILFMIGLGAIIPLMNSVLYEDPTMQGFFEFTYIVLLISSVIIGLFVYKDYSQNTIRNKVIVGHSRATVYFSKALLVALSLIGFFLIFLLSTFVVGMCIGDLSYLNMSVFIQSCVIVICSILTAASLISLIAVNIQSPVGALLPMMLLFSIMFLSMLYAEMLMINEQTEILELLQTLPLTSCLMLNEVTKPFNMVGTIIYSIITCAVMQIFGCGIFQRINLK